MQHWNLTPKLLWRTGKKKQGEKGGRKKRINEQASGKEKENLVFSISFLLQLSYSRIFPFKMSMVSSHVGKCHLAGRGIPSNFFPFLFFTTSPPVLSLSFTPSPTPQKLPYDCVHYANECLTGVMASGRAGRDEGGQKETKMKKINNLDGQLKLPRSLFS